jgi:hypothetical protein
VLTRYYRDVYGKSWLVICVLDFILWSLVFVLKGWVMSRSYSVWCLNLYYLLGYIVRVGCFLKLKLISQEWVDNTSIRSAGIVVRSVVFPFFFRSEIQGNDKQSVIPSLKYLVSGILYIIGRGNSVLFTLTDAFGFVKYWECPNSLERVIRKSNVGQKRRKIKTTLVALVECIKTVYLVLRRLNYRCLQIVVRGHVKHLGGIFTKVFSLKHVLIYSIMYDSRLYRSRTRLFKMRWRKRRHIFFV